MLLAHRLVISYQIIVDCLKEGQDSKLFNLQIEPPLLEP